MRAVVCSRYGPPDVLVVKEVPTPTPGPGQIRIRIAAFPVVAPDRRIRGLSVPFPRAAPLIRLFLRAMFGLVRPRHPILGDCLSGTVDAIGTGVDAHHVGDEVFGLSDRWKRATYAEYVCLPQDAWLTPKPPNVGLIDAAALPYGGCNALHFLRVAGGVHAGQKLLVRGAAGAVGSSIVQLAKASGADVTGLCSGDAQALVESIGADRVTVYTDAEPLGRGGPYDLVIDAVGGTHRDDWGERLSPDGHFVTVLSKVAQSSHADLTELAHLVETGSFRPVVDQYFPLEQTAAAHAHGDRGHARGTPLVVADRAVDLTGLG